MGLTAGLLVLAAVFALTISVLVAQSVRALLWRRQEKREVWARDFLRVALHTATVAQVRGAVERGLDAFMGAYMDLRDAVDLPESMRAKVTRALIDSGRETRLLHDVMGRRRWHRTRAAIYLGYIGTESAMRALVFALEREPYDSVRLHIVHSLVHLGYPAAIPTIVDSLAGARREYQQRVQGLIGELGAEALEYFPLLSRRSEYEIELLLLHLAGRFPTSETRSYVVRQMDNSFAAVRHIAVRTYLRHFATLPEVEALIDSDDRLTANLALEALSRYPSRHALDRVAEEVANPATQKSAVLALSEMVRRAPHLYAEVLRAYARADSDEVRRRFLVVIALKTEYLLERFLRTREDAMIGLLGFLLQEGWTGGIVAFLNRNDDEETLRVIAGAIGPYIRDNDALRREFSWYAKATVQDALGISRQEIDAERGERRGEVVRRRTVILVIVATVALPLAGYVSWWFAWWFGDGRSLDVLALGAGYLRFFLWGFGGYAGVLNLSYALLLVFAALEAHRQRRNFAIKPLSMLFRPHMLPAISIIVPAYKEEATIVENVNSLLNLRYPDFEVIVVNDGSTDATLQSLIDHFELERVDVFVHSYLRTQPLRGLYRNPAIPELLVVDKKNGGKADSLNAGINVSRKDYFAAIDSDSILERDALLHMTAHFIDSEVPVVATGGNVLPVNGCSVDRGVLGARRLPRNLLARFQAVEYIRSFMAGRTGWARLGSLMIISGAFGLFRKRDVVDARGYLTGAELLGKDTVAEDMELVVRVSRQLRKSGKHFAVHYAHNANCWTEVPEKPRILANQRDRWQRGLIDTMWFHRRLFGNANYGNMGLIGFPFYGVFELLGPWIEVQGLLFLILAAATGAVAWSVLLVVFAVAVPLGVLVSTASMLLAEDTMRRFPLRDRIGAVLLSIAENFGYRQFASFLRIRAYISVLRQKTGWGTMVRRGFANAPTVRSS